MPLTIWSKPSAMKSPNMISRIGRRPLSPSGLAPNSDSSLIGVVSTRSGQRSLRPRVILKAPVVEDVLADENDVVTLLEDLVQGLVECVRAAHLSGQSRCRPPPGRAPPSRAPRRPSREQLLRSRRGRWARKAYRRRSADPVPVARRSRPDPACRRRVRAEAIRVDREVGETAGRADAVDHAARFPVHGQHVRGVEVGRVDAERQRAVGNRTGDRQLTRRRLRVVVVLDEKQDRQRPERREFRHS